MKLTSHISKSAAWTKKSTKAAYCVCAMSGMTYSNILRHPVVTIVTRASS